MTSIDDNPSFLSKPNESDIKEPNNITEFQNTSSYSLNRLKQLLDKEDSKSNMYSKFMSNNSENQSSISDINNSITKKDLFDNINKMLDESNKKGFKILNNQNKIYQGENIKQNKNNNNINTSDILGLTLELAETKKTNQMMKDNIDELKAKITKNELEYKEDLKQQLDKQKFNYENSIQRLKDLIDNLMNEKKKLNLTIESLNEQLNNIDSNNKKKIQELNLLHENDIQKSKDAWFKAEKIRRKKWEEEKIKEIRELTVKNLEPELDKILQDHKADLFKQEEDLKENFRAQKERLISDYEDKIRKLKNKFEKEKDEIQDNERKFYSKRLREQNEKLEDQHTEEQKKWYVNLQDEITRLEE